MAEKILGGNDQGGYPHEGRNQPQKWTPPPGSPSGDQLGRVKGPPVYKVHKPVPTQRQR